MNVILYCRVSTEEQKDGCSLDVQEKYLRAHCERNDFNVIDVYREDFSARGHKLVRPELKKLYDYCKKNTRHVDKVLFYRWDRFTRDAEFGLTYKRKFIDELGIEINAIENPIDFSAPEWCTMLPLFCGVAHTEDEKISKRTKDGIHGTLLKGKCSGLAPRGYKNVRVAKHACWVEIDEKEANEVKAIFNEVALGVEAPLTIRRRLFPSIPKNTFLRILCNHFYIGEIFVPAYRGEPEQYVQGIHKPIIDKETFYKVQDIISGNRKKQPKLTKSVAPELFLRKFLICPVCGHILTGAFSKGNGGRYPYYFCNNEHKHMNVRAEKVNEGFIEFLSGLKPNNDVMDLYNEILQDIRGEKVQENEQKINALKAEITQLSQRAEKVKDLFYDGEIAKQEKEEAIERITNQIKAMKTQIEALELGNNSPIREKLDYSINLIANLSNFVSQAPTEVKIKLLGSFFPEKIEFDGKNYRTKSFNSMLDYIFQETKQLQGNRKESDSKNHSQFNLGCPVGLEPTTFRTTI